MFSPELNYCIIINILELSISYANAKIAVISLPFSKNKSRHGSCIEDLNRGRCHF